MIPALLMHHPDRGRLGHHRDSTFADACRDRTRARLASVQGVGPIRCVDAPPMPRAARRRFAAASWRGGLGGATVYDELLDAAALLDACETLGLTDDDPFLLCGSDWTRIDPGLTAALLDRYAASVADDAPLRLVFCQAPPGLAPVLLTRGLLHEFQGAGAGFSGLLAYDPRLPRLDPISKDLCVAIPTPIRNGAWRFIPDTPAARARDAALTSELADDADTAEVIAAANRLERGPAAPLPDEILTELTDRSPLGGPVGRRAARRTTQTGHPSRFDTDWLNTLAPQLAGRSVLLGGIGEPLDHPHFQAVVDTVRRLAPDVCLGVDTALLPTETCPDPAGTLIDAGVDLVAVRLHADTPAVYAAATGRDPNDFDVVRSHMQRLLDHRLGESARPEIVPQMMKCAATLGDLEPFFIRNWQVAGHATLQRAPTCGLGPAALLADLNPVPMERPFAADAAYRPAAPPPRKRRLTIRSSGVVTLCAQDDDARFPLGHVTDVPLVDLWQNLLDGRPPGFTPDDSPLCRACTDWLNAR